MVILVWEHPPTRPALVASSLDYRDLYAKYSNRHAKSKVQESTFFPYIYPPESNPSLPLLFYYHSRKAKEVTMAFHLRESKLPILPFAVLVFISILIRCLHASDPPLTLDYYASTCPSVFEIVKKEMECEVLSEPRNAALIVRLHFHDCFVQVRNSQFLAVSLSFCNSNIFSYIYIQLYSKFLILSSQLIEHVPINGAGM